MLTEQTLRKLWPHVDEAKPGLISAVVAAAPGVFQKYGLTTPLTVAHAMAQFSEEFGADLPAHKIEFDEDMSYSTDGLMKTWPKHFTSYAFAAQYAHNPQKLANFIYEPPIHNDLGNRPNSGDGWAYHGRGGSQVTGRGDAKSGYVGLARLTGLDLLGDPEMVNEPEHFLECAVGDFILCGCLPFAERDDVRGVTHHLNGAYIGLDVRERWLERWKTALAAEGHPAAPQAVPDGTIAYGSKGFEVEAIQAALIKKGYQVGGEPDGDFGDKTRAAVLAFQGTEGLPTTGVVDQATKAALESAPPRPIDEDRATATADDLRGAGSQTVAHADNLNLVAKAGVAVGGGTALNQSGALDQVQSLVSSVGGPHEALSIVQNVLQWTEQHLWIGIVAGGAAVWYFGRNIIAQRLADHRSGVHLGR
jgi:putative chitinase